MIPLASSTWHRLHASRAVLLLYVTVFPRSLQILFLEVLMQRGILNYALLKISDSILLPMSEQEDQGDRAHSYFNSTVKGLQGRNYADQFIDYLDFMLKVLFF